MKNFRKKNPGTKNLQKGFSLMEVMISIMVLMTAFISLLGLFGLAVAATEGAQRDLIAKQLASAAVESIFTARDTTQLNWAAIQNASNGGVFMDGFQPVNKAGGDGIIGTADDAVAGAQTINQLAPDGVTTTPLSLANYQRSIAIVPAKDSSGNAVATLRQITVTVQYVIPGNKTPKTYALTSYISFYR